MYSKNNITIETDATIANNKLVTLSTVFTGATKAYSNSRIETGDMTYFEGTYAARVFFTDNPNTYKDGNIQTFYTITDYTLHENAAKYSEIDFEYMASDYWGTGTSSDKVMYMTSWNHVIEDPWDAYKAYLHPKGTMAGWHTLVVTAADKKNVKFYIDGVLKGQISVTDGDNTQNNKTLSVYPRTNMQVAFANWIYNDSNGGLGSSTANRTSTMKVDWVMYYKDQDLTPTQVNTYVTDYRTRGLRRRNLAGQEYYETVTGLEEVEINTELVVIPNPSTSGVFNLKNSLANAVVYNPQGEIVATVENASIIDLSKQTAGVYFLKTETQTLKLIKY
ncbi:MAG: T9SS type A sorting domain-containing protein [Pedobacter sp.]|nr:T9SS type A sorting domain-containing protein [Pedobacter sp.]